MTEGRKDDDGKLRYDLIPPDALQDLVEILTDGAEKYGDRNWEHGMSWGRCFAAAQRHLWAWWSGQDADADSGRSHLAHAAVNMLFLLAYQRRGAGTDDRTGLKPHERARVDLPMTWEKKCQ